MAPDSVSAPVRTPDTNAEREDSPVDDSRNDARPHPVAQPESAEQLHACPLCGYTDETRDSVFTHLLLSHRKRAISSALLEAHASAGAAGHE